MFHKTSAEVPHLGARGPTLRMEINLGCQVLGARCPFPHFRCSLRSLHMLLGLPHSRVAWLQQWLSQKRLKYISFLWHCSKSHMASFLTHSIRWSNKTTLPSSKGYKIDVRVAKRSKLQISTLSSFLTYTQ